MNIFRTSPTSIYKPTSGAAVSAAAAATAESSALASNQRILITVLGVILVFSLLGTNSFNIIGDGLNYLIKKVGEFIMYFAANLGYSTGSIINTTANVASNATVTSAQIADGAMNSVGDIFRESNADRATPSLKQEMDEMNNASRGFLLLPNGKTPEQIRAEGGGKLSPAAGGGDVAGMRRDLDDVINRINKIDGSLAKNDTAESTIQKPISATKAGWCLVGEYQSKRGCASVNTGDICNSGKLYATKEQCLQGGVAGIP